MSIRPAWLEGALVLVLVVSIALFGGGKFTDWSAALAVFLGFLCTQVSFDLTEYQEQAQPSSSTLQASSKLGRMHLIKEFAWVVTFTALQSYPLVVGALVFMAYPCARRILRGQEIRHPYHS